MEYHSAIISIHITAEIKNSVSWNHTHLSIVTTINGRDNVASFLTNHLIANLDLRDSLSLKNASITQNIKSIANKTANIVNDSWLIHK